MNIDTREVEFADVCFGCCWGDEGKGKIVAQLAKEGGYDYVCRWAGGNNAGHTVYVNSKKYATHLIPSGVFYGVKSIIGPGCVVNIKAFFKEINYLKENGFDTNLIKISPCAHVIQDYHLEDDMKYYGGQGTTRRGIAPCYRDKFGRTGKRVQDFVEFNDFLWDGYLSGKVLCEGAQGTWLDPDFGNYPYVTSSTTLPYGIGSLGIPPQLVRNIYGAAKIYDTRVGTDPYFPENLLDDPTLHKLAILGGEYGVSTGRMRKTNWLNLDKLIQSVVITGTTILVISKTDILEDLNIFKLYHNMTLVEFESLDHMCNYILDTFKTNKCRFLERIIFSNNPEKVDNLI